MNYLDQTGLAHVWSKIKTYVTDQTTPLNEKIFDAHGSVSLTISPSIVENGVSTQVTIRNNITLSGKTYTPNSISIKQGDDELSTAANNSFTQNVSATTTYTATVEFIDNVSKTVTATVTGVYPMYFGGNASTTLASADITSMTKQSLKTSPSGSYNVSVGQGQYMWLCIPSNMNINKVTSSGFDVPMETAATVAVDGKGNYKCYRSSSQFNAGTVAIVVS
jgi:hypothetical protein